MYVLVLNMTYWNIEVYCEIDLIFAGTWWMSSLYQHQSKVWVEQRWQSAGRRISDLGHSASGHRIWIEILSPLLTRSAYSTYSGSVYSRCRKLLLLHVQKLKYAGVLFGVCVCVGGGGLNTLFTYFCSAVRHCTGVRPDCSPLSGTPLVTHSAWN